ncbi:uncharacterized protein LOC114527422 [Dendronephthya gigantea]|uniref:uncharacterized protein LOC114527422 n=1 Tax=Dendronephthya gigantea TaxID=151771 RepID=UPI00106D91DE|nr:uncharacterized protein LOC114527422 [Dendronephthya gigantea]XP_028404854.1 uncharacterized protein LOC114527422 [Dendronephthya gigantea]
MKLLLYFVSFITITTQSFHLIVATVITTSVLKTSTAIARTFTTIPTLLALPNMTTKPIGKSTIFSVTSYTTFTNRMESSLANQESFPLMISKKSMVIASSFSKSLFISRIVLISSSMLPLAVSKPFSSSQRKESRPRKLQSTMAVKTTTSTTLRTTANMAMSDVTSLMLNMTKSSTNQPIVSNTNKTPSQLNKTKTNIIRPSFTVNITTMKTSMATNPLTKAITSKFSKFLSTTRIILICSSISLSNLAVNKSSSEQKESRPGSMASFSTSSSRSSEAASLIISTISLPTTTRNILPTKNLTTGFPALVTNMSSTIIGISYFPSVSSLTYSSSSQVTTPFFPEVVSVRLTIDSNCTQVPNVQSAAFKLAVKQSCSQVLNISISKINISKITCGSILVDMTIQNVKNENIFQKLFSAIKNNELNITYDGTKLQVTSVNITRPATLPSPTRLPTSNGGDSDNKTALILYIVVGSVLGLIFLTGVIALVCHRCFERSTTPRTVHENLKLSELSCGNKSGGNFYGHQQPESSQIGISGIPNESGTADDDETDNVGSSFLPEWKSQSTLDMSDVVHEDDTTELKVNDVFLTYGKPDTGDGNTGFNNPIVSSEDIDTV